MEFWVGKNKSDGKVVLFGSKPRRYHDGYFLTEELKGFNDNITVGNGKDTYSYWAANNDAMSRGISFWENEDDYPKVLRELRWEDSPRKVNVVVKG